MMTKVMTACVAAVLIAGCTSDRPNGSTAGTKPPRMSAPESMGGSGSISTGGGWPGGVSGIGITSGSPGSGTGGR